MKNFHFLQEKKGSLASMTVDPPKPKQVTVTPPGQNKPKPVGPGTKKTVKADLVSRASCYNTPS